MAVAMLDGYRERLLPPRTIGMVRTSRVVDLAAGRPLTAGGAEVVELEAGDRPAAGSVDLLAAVGASAALPAAQAAVAAGIPLLLLPDSGMPRELGAHLHAAPVITYSVLTYRIAGLPRPAVAEVDVAAAEPADLTIAMDTGAEVVAEPVGAGGVRLLSSVPLPGWSRPTAALHPQLGAVALAESGTGADRRPDVRAVLPAEAIMSVTATGQLTVVADRGQPQKVSAGEVYLGPHEDKLRLVSLPGADAHTRVVTDQDAGLARFARRVTTLY